MKVIRIRLVPVILAISLLITIFAVAKTFAVTNAQVATETLRVREEADTKSSITMLLSAGNKVEVLEATGEWYKIKSNGKTGYVKKEFVRVLGNSEVEQTENKANNEASNKSENIVETVKQQITEGFTGSLMSPVDIKILPKINSNNIGVITQGEQIEVVEVINDWCRVQTEEAIGWVRKNAIAQKAEGEEASVQEQDVNSSNDAIVSRIAQAKLSSRSATTTRQKAATNVESTASNASTTVEKAGSQTDCRRYFSMYRRRNPADSFRCGIGSAGASDFRKFRRRRRTRRSFYACRCRRCSFRLLRFQKYPL